MTTFNIVTKSHTSNQIVVVWVMLQQPWSFLHFYVVSILYCIYYDIMQHKTRFLLYH